MADPKRTPSEDLLLALALQADAPGADAGPCPEADVLAALLTDGLIPGERTSLQHHLARCPTCVAVVADLTSDADVMEEPAGRPRPSAALVAAERSQGRRWLLAVAAAALAAIGLWSLFVQSDPPAAPVSLAEAGATLRRAHPELCADLVPLSLDELRSPVTVAERGGLPPFAPRGVSLSARPTFRFAPQPGVASYELRVLTDTGDEVWTSTTDTSEFAYPEAQAGLVRGGRYVWEVSFERLGRQVARLGFAVASEDVALRFGAAVEAIAAQAPEDSRLLLSAHLAVRRQHWGAARRLAAEALAARPDGELERATAAYVRKATGEAEPEDDDR